MIDLSPEVAAIVMIGLLLAFLFIGYPVGFAMGGVAFLGFLIGGTRILPILYSQAYGIMTSYVLVAVPLFIFMGLMIERSGQGKAVFDALGMWLHRLPGNIAVVVILTGTLLAAAMGVLAASVVMLGLIALPHMMERGYNKELATGAICAGGTLGLQIPPSVLLVLYGPLANISVGKLFMGAIGPGLTLSGLYTAYVIIASIIKPNWAPAIRDAVKVKWSRKIRLLFTSVVPVVGLILAVLGSIFFGIAAPTEAAAIGAFAAMLLALARKEFNWPMLKQAVIGTYRSCGMIAVVIFGALAFNGVFLALGGKEVVINFILGASGGKWGVFFLIMFIIFILGMLIEWLGIAFILVPLITPMAEALGFDALWFAMMVIVNFQMAFMSPPFAITIYFLKGVIPPEYGITTGHIMRGVIPFLLLIWVSYGLFIAFPQIVLWLPSQMFRMR